MNKMNKIIELIKMNKYSKWFTFSNVTLILSFIFIISLLVSIFYWIPEIGFALLACWATAYSIVRITNFFGDLY